MNRLARSVLVAGAVVASASIPAVSRAQMGPPPPGGAVTIPEPAPAQPGPSQPGQPSAPSTTGFVPLGLGGWGQQPSGPIGGGNATESSSHPVTGEEQDSFDLSKNGSHDSAAHGTYNGPVFTGAGQITGVTGAVSPPATHIVQRGDTLWAVCDHYLNNPYQWPRVWSYNPQIKNPNWIYPGDELRLRGASGAPETNAPARAPGGPQGGGKLTLLDRRRHVPQGTLFLRDQGWISDEQEEVWGEVSGAAQETMFLSDLNEVYLTVKSGHDPRVGQELTVFRTRQTAAAGAIVQILGTVRIDAWNPKERVARAQIVETLDTIERGAKIGPIARTFMVVPPATNGAEVKAHVLASLRPNELFGQNQLVFIDKGEAAGLQPGNRLVVRRRGDAWRQTLISEGAGNRISTDDERPMPPMERTPGTGADDNKFPDETVAELRVLTTKKDSAACLVTQSRVEIDTHDIAYARKGY